MNHYPRHIGDWMRDTAHLSEVEECIYSRMIDQYYSREKALPSDKGAVCRLVRAASKEARKAVDVVLLEFFTLEADGWHQKRCDAEIAQYLEGADEREQKNAHEAERMRRHRERRKQLFATLRERGIVPKWDTQMAELERLCNANSNAPATDLQREQVPNCNASATANQNQNQNQYIKDAEPDGSHENAAPQKTEAPPKPADVIWTLGVRLLTEKGASEDAARAFLGKHAKGAESQLAEVIGHLATHPKVDPKAYISKAMQPKTPQVVL